MLLSRIVKKKSTPSLPNHMIITEEHKQVLNKFAGKSILVHKQFFHPDPQELVIKHKEYSVAKEYEDGIFICYSLYLRRSLQMVIYESEVKLYLRKGI